MDAVIVIGYNYHFNKNDFINKYVIGVDKGALYCLENNIKMDCAIGDFDSIDEKSYIEINKITKVIKLNPIKDETDTQEALKLCKNMDSITIVGGILGKRIEHFYANLLLLKKYSNLYIKDDYSLIMTSNKSITIEKNEYKYISIFSIDPDTNITLNGFKYNLKDYNLSPDCLLGISNEIIENKATLSLKSGKIILFFTKEDNEVLR